MKVVTRRRITLWKMPKRKPFVPQGIALGATVTNGRQTGQIWSRSASPKCWWVATGQRFVELHESDITVLGQCVEQLALEVAA